MNRTAHAPIDRLEPRYLFAAGDPIEAFGDAGTAALDRAYANVVPSQILPLRSGKTLVAVNAQYEPRSRYDGSFDSTLVDLIRLNADGTPDLTFGTDGRGGVDVPFFTHGYAGDTPDAQGVLEIHERSDGKVFALGHSYDDTIDRLSLARFNEDGTLDTTFGDAGRVELDVSDLHLFRARFPFIRIYDDGAVLMASEYGMVQRFNPDGPRDADFGVDGKVVLTNHDDRRYFFTRYATFAEDGSVYLSGTRRRDMFRGRNVIRKLTPTGQIDTAFGVDGEIETGRDLFPTQLARVSGGWVALVWASPNGYDFTVGAPRLMKFSDAGVLDPAFGVGGIVQHSTYDADPPTQVMVDDQDRIVTLSAYSGQGARGSGRMVRYNPDGSVDATFGTLDWPTGSTVLMASAPHDGSFVVATESRLMSLASDGPASGPVSITRNGTLTLRGTTRAEKLSIDERYVASRDDYVTQWFARRDAWGRMIDMSAVKRLVIDAGAGDDIITAPLTKRPVTLVGGRGNDQLFAGFRSTYLRNVGAADDVVLSGGDGDDRITFFGNAILATGGRGNDRIIGNFAGTGTTFNLIRGGEGDDDILTTGPRNQRAFDCFGDDGNDTLTSGGCLDLLDGGPGTDTAVADPNDILVRTEA